MSRLSFLLLLLVASLAVVCAAHVRYDGYTVLRLDLDRNNIHHVHAVKKLQTNKLGFYVSEWSHRDYMVSPTHLPTFTAWLEKKHIKYSTYIHNVQELIDRERQHSAMIRLQEMSTEAPQDFFADYRSNDEIEKYVDGLINQYPGLIKKTTIGTTYEGRNIYAYTITGNATSANKPGIFFEGGIHAREWITHATQCYILTQLVTQYGVNAQVTSVMDAIEWTIIPVLNVDGYVYTRSTDRMWRKTRSPNVNSTCIGTDPNRNWDSHWCEQGADTDPCSESYCGPSAFSEKCVSSVAKYILTKSNVQVFIDFHSYSQLWMSPYGYTSNLPADYQVQTDLGQKSVAAILANGGMTYQEGTIYNIIYPASGSSADWGYDTAKIKFSYGVEQRDQGQYGFLLPANQIIPSGQEIFAAALVMANYIMNPPSNATLA